MKKTLLFVAMSFFSVLATEAQTKQSVTVNGTMKSQNVKQLTFNGDNVDITYSNGTKESADLSYLSIDFDYSSVTIPSTVTGINALNDNSRANRNDNVYNIAGQKIGKKNKGVIIKQGKKYIKK